MTKWKSTTDLVPWLQDALCAEHFLCRASDELLDNRSLAKDLEASLLVRLVNDRAKRHLDDIEVLLSRRHETPSGVREALGKGLGTMLGWVERLPDRDLVQVVRDVYVALNYTSAGYHVLYTRALLLERDDAAGLSLRHLRDYTPAIRQLSQLLAWVSALDLSPELWSQEDAMKQIVATLFEAWSSDLPLQS